MENANPIQPLQNPGEQNQPSVLDRVLGRQEPVTEPGGNIIVGDDNILKPELDECINPSCAAAGGTLNEGVCGTCGFNAKERY